MANILITTVCNRQCSFCFAKKRLDKYKAVESPVSMPREQLRELMDFLETTGERDLRVLGGEPTIHPEFCEIVTEAVDRGFRVHVFTNGMMKREVAEHLAPYTANQVSILCNISPQARDTESLKKRRHEALGLLGDKVVPGITITDPQFEYEFLIDCIKQYGMRKRIRIGIAQPIVGEDNMYLHPDKYKQAGTALVEMARQCVKEDILIGFDCGITLCMFTEDELGFLAKNSEGVSSICNPIIDIGTSMDVWSCFPLSEVLNTRLEYFKNRRDIVRFYQKLLAPYRSLGCKAECMQCDYLRRGQCSGGCLAHAMNSLGRKPPELAPVPDGVSGASGILKTGKGVCDG